jgi:hypothetical protein
MCIHEINGERNKGKERERMLTNKLKEGERVGVGML